MVVPGTFVALEIFKQVGVEGGRADLVDAHGPFAEVDAAAAVRAEGKIFVSGFDQLFAGWALERLDFDFRGFGHGLRLGTLFFIFAVLLGFDQV
jgi:hypothetical protein